MDISRRSIAGAVCLIGMFVCGFLVRGFVLPGGDGAVPIVQASEEANAKAKKCSNRTLKGTYGIKFEGQSLAGGPFASVSRITFDGQGTFTTVEVGRFNGQPVERTFTGPYTVNEDCTGFLDFSSTITNPPHEAHGSFVIVDGGNEFYVVDNEDGWAANGVGKKM